MVYRDLGRAAPAWKKCPAQKREKIRNSAFFEILSVVYSKTVRVFRILEVYTTGPFISFSNFGGIHHGFLNFGGWCIPLFLCFWGIHQNLKFIDFFSKFLGNLQRRATSRGQAAARISDLPRLGPEDYGDLAGGIDGSGRARGSSKQQAGKPWTASG